MSESNPDLYSLIQAAAESEPLVPARATSLSHPVPAGSTPRVMDSSISSASLKLMLSGPLMNGTPTSANPSVPFVTSDNPGPPNAVALEMARLNYLHQLQQAQQWQLSQVTPQVAINANLNMDVDPPVAGSQPPSAPSIPSSTPLSVPSNGVPTLSRPPTSQSKPHACLLPPIPLPPRSSTAASTSVGSSLPHLESSVTPTERENLIRTLLMELYPSQIETAMSMASLGEALKPLLCELCGHEEPNKIDLTIHQKDHRHRSGSFKCELPRCHSEFDSFQNLIQHRQARHHIHGFGSANHQGWIHMNPPSSSKASTRVLDHENDDDYHEEPMHMPRSGMSVDGESETHDRHTGHSSSSTSGSKKHKSFKCTNPGCDSTFQSYSGLKYHTLLHTGAKEHKCPWPGCSAAFTNSSGLKIHKMTHDPASKAWKCAWEGCRAAFTTSSALATHTRTHTGSKPYACTWTNCDKNFARADHLKIHLRSHTNERPYICDVCGKGFTNSSGLRTHEKTHRHPMPSMAASSSVAPPAPSQP